MSRDWHFLGVRSVAELKVGEIASQDPRVQFHALYLVAPKSLWGQFEWDNLIKKDGLIQILSGQDLGNSDNDDPMVRVELAVVMMMR